MIPALDQPLIAPNISQERMRLLLTATIAANRSLNPREIAHIALWLAIDTLNLDIGMVLLFQGKQQIILATQGFSSTWLNLFQSSPPDLDGTFITRTLETGRAEVHTNLLHIPGDKAIQGLRQSRLQSLVCLPLRIPGNAPGIILVGASKPRQFPAGDVEFLQEIAGQISSCLRNAWLYAQSQRQLKELKSVAEAARAVVSSLDLNQILTHIMEDVTAQLNVEAAALLLLDPIREELEFAAVAGPESASLKGVRLPMGHGIVGWVAERNKPLLVPDVTLDKRFYQGLDKKTETVSQSILCVPLQARNQLIGVVEVINKKRGKFSQADQRHLESLASFAAVAIENARLYEEANRQIEQAAMYALDLNTTYKREREQREAMDKLRHSFLNVVGHELKTPLTVILQGLEALKNPLRGSLNPEQDDIVISLGHQSSYLQRLIDGLVTFARFSARQGKMKLKPVSFGTILDEVIALSQFKANPKGIVLEDRRPTHLPTLSLDKDQLSEAMVHIIDNAVKFSAEGSRVIIETEINEDELVVAVIDQGCGIAPDQVDQIWDSFTQMNTTLERGLEGLGLGLALATYIVESHNGTISAESEPGQGSTFRIRLPCTTE